MIKIKRKIILPSCFTLLTVLLLTSCIKGVSSSSTLTVEDINLYFVGQNYKDYGNALITLKSFLKEERLEISDPNLAFYDCKDPDNESFLIEDTFNKTGEYEINVKYKDKYTANFKIDVGNGAFVPDELTYLSQDVQTNYAPALGNQKMLVIPIKLESGSLINSSTAQWTTTKLQNIDNYYFGTVPNSISLKDYYSTASFGKLNITGMVSDVYEETSPSLTMSEIDGDTTYQKLFTLISRAVEWVEAHYPLQDWKEYDTNGDGCLDSVHLITNFNATKWNSPLWPHMYETGNTSGTHENPVANVYSISAINHVGSAITAIHEQGHIFGLQDYYDYSDDGTSARDYVGQADMQSHNVFDWNSFSKLSVGWTKPLVVDGTLDSVTVSLRPASSSGDCLLVPTPGTWNGSAFDEYILIELFTKVGNNIRDWLTWNNLKTGGIRLYHVDARIYGYDFGGGEYNAGENGGIVDNVKTSSYNHHVVGANNSYDPSAYMSVPGFENFKLLTLIQRGGVNTFGSASKTQRHALTYDDLFITGSSFTFEAYKQFFLKQSSPVATSMDDGTIFPYTIHFDSVDTEKAVITITKN
ncbi:MAG: hypothetical protein WCZ24_03500 [Bacilli bacterium]